MNEQNDNSHLLNLYHKDDPLQQPLSPEMPIMNSAIKLPRSLLIETLKKLKLPSIDYFLRKTSFCRHDYGCLENVISGTLSSLILSYILSVGINFLSLVAFKRRYNEFIRSLFRFESLRMCGFITSYTFILKVSICILRKIRNCDDQVNNFLSGALAGFFSLGCLEKVSRMTWSGYLLARAFDAMYKHLVNKKAIKKKEWHYILIFAIMYGFYGYCIALENDVMPPSIGKFFNNVYRSTFEKNRITLNNVMEQQQNENLARKYGKWK